MSEHGRRGGSRSTGAGPRALARFSMVAVALLTGACGTTPDGDAGRDGGSSSGATGTGDTTTTVFTGDPGSTTVVADDRPAELEAPAEVDQPAPLLIVLHGYDRTPADTDALLDTTAQATGRGAYVLYPTGRPDASGHPYWNASDACCDYHSTDVDDVGYVRDVLAEVLAERPIDRSRIYVLGHSAGGFMAYRLACELGDVVAVAVVAGADVGDGCDPPAPVSVLHLQGDADDKVDLAGGELDAPYPGAVDSAAVWAERNGCGASTVALDPLDLVTDVPGAETTVEAYEGCPEGVDVALGVMAGAGHEPLFDPDAVGVGIIDWLFAHRR